MPVHLCLTLLHLIRILDPMSAFLPQNELLLYLPHYDMT